MLSVLLRCFQPILDAFSFRPLPFSYRWRLLLLQPINLLANSLKYLPWMFSRAYITIKIPTRDGRRVRAIVFRPSPDKREPEPRLHPLHLDCHGGAFLGGLAEFDAAFGKLVADRTGAVVVCTQYRCAPADPFPAAIDDIDDVIAFLQKHGEDKFGADPTLFTVSGFSAGGNLALAATQQPNCHTPSPTAIKASVTFFASVSIK
jgi:acetyl esterase/lipase